MMNTTKYPNYEKLVRDLDSKIDRVQYGPLYMREDSNIETIVVVAPGYSLAEVAAHLVEGSPSNVTMEQLTAEGKVVAVLPDNRAIPHGEADDFYVEHAHEKVSVLYCPPGYFVQLTGEVWSA
jgi:hypothetical protein